MIRTHEQLVHLLNSHGFLFQLRIAHEVRSKQTRWRIVGQEHRWIDPDSGDEGFIDLVLESDGFVAHTRLVLECKRVQDVVWTFLIPSNTSLSQRMRMLWAAVAMPEGKSVMNWDDFTMTMKFHESSFCVVEGQDKDRPMLERLSGLVTQSLECVAEEESRLFGDNPLRPPRVYTAVIVTTAELAVYEYDPTEVNLADGKLPMPATPDHPIPLVPFVAFRKSLASKLGPAHAESLAAANMASERSVFIVQANYFLDFLKAYDFTAPYGWSQQLRNRQSES